MTFHVHPEDITLSVRHLIWDKVGWLFMKWPMNIQWTASLKNLLTERRKITFVVYLVNRLLCHLFWCSAEKYLAKICKYVNFGANLLFDDIILHFHLSTGSLRWKLICVFIHFVCWDFFMCLFSIRQFTVDEKWSYILARNSKCRFESLTMTGGGRGKCLENQVAGSRMNIN